MIFISFKIFNLNEIFKLNFINEINRRFFYISNLYIAVSNDDLDMIKLLSSYHDIDLNLGYILIIYFLYCFIILLFHRISST